jgi:hypothetical protein
MTRHLVHHSDRHGLFEVMILYKWRSGFMLGFGAGNATSAHQTAPHPPADAGADVLGHATDPHGASDSARHRLRPTGRGYRSPPLLCLPGT